MGILIILPSLIAPNQPQVLAITSLRRPLLQGQLVRNHGDELPIGRLVLLGRHPAAEGLVQRMRVVGKHFIAILTRR